MTGMGIHIPEAKDEMAIKIYLGERAYKLNWRQKSQELVGLRISNPHWKPTNNSDDSTYESGLHGWEKIGGELL